MVSHRNDQVLEILEKTSIAAYFYRVVTSNSGFKRKPDPESMIYLRENIRLVQALSLVIDRLISKPGEAAGLATHLFTSIVNLRQVLDM